MTLQQGLAFGILGAMMGLFVWGRLRYDLVAALSLLAAVLAGIVPAKEAFKGFSDDVVIIVASALLVSAAIARSGAVDAAMRFASPHVRSPRAQMILLVTAVTVFSAFIKNIGALAMMIPVAFQFARRSGVSVSRFLMPMAFASLLGGIVTLVGTSPNIIVARVRQELIGEPFQMFDFTPVGLGIAAAGVAFLIFGSRLLPDRQGAVGLDAALEAHDYTTEAKVPQSSPMAGRTVADLRKLGEDEVSVVGIVRNDNRSARPLPDVEIRPDDTVLLEGPPKALESLVAHAELKLTRDDRPLEKGEATDEVGVIEAVIGADSLLADHTVEQVALYQRFGVNLLAVSRRGERITERLRSLLLRAGDAVVVQGVLRFLPETLKQLNLLPLAERSLGLGSARRGSIAVAILAATILLVAFDVVPVAVAFFGAAVLLVLFGALPIREAYQQHRMADPRHARRADPGLGRAPHHRRDRAPRDLAFARRRHAAAGRRRRARHGRRDGGDALPQQRRDGARHGADRGKLRDPARLSPRRLPDGDRDRRRLRFPDADRPPVQHARDGPGRLQVRRLQPARRAAVADRADRRRAADPRGLADRQALTASPARAPPGGGLPVMMMPDCAPSS